MTSLPDESQMAAKSAVVADHDSSRQLTQLARKDLTNYDVSSLDFVSLGMLIIGMLSNAITIDEAECPDDVYQHGRTPLLNKLGGAGTYATLGARLLRPIDRGRIDDQPSKVGFVIHAGSDFPKSVAAELEAWNTSSPTIQTPGRLTTRGKNVYQDEVRGD